MTTANEPTYQRILITGASGYLGGVLRKAFKGRFAHLRLTDVVPLPDAVAALDEGEEFIRCDLTDAAGLEAIARDCDAVVHLGACSVEAGWEKILPANIEGTYNAFEAARKAGVKRFVYASSHHAVGYYRRTQTIGTDVQPRPDSRYGVSKVFGEALGRMYADKYGMQVVSQRIAVARPEPQTARGVVAWLSERDYAQLTLRCLLAPDIHYHVVYGVSANGGYWDDASGRAIGYVPQDNGLDYAAKVHATHPPEAEPPIEKLFQGGWFTAMEFVGSPDRVD